MRFWLDRGVDGFRVDVAHSMAKEPGLPDMDLSILDRVDGWAAHAARSATSAGTATRCTTTTAGSGGCSTPTPATGWPSARRGWPTRERLARYVRPDELNLTFNFELVEADWGAGGFREAIERSLAAHGRGGRALHLGARRTTTSTGAATRYGGGALGVARARAAALVQLSLPGAAYLYNGDELGLENVDLPDEALQDPTWERSGHTDRGRDGERVPLPWSRRRAAVRVHHRAVNVAADARRLGRRSPPPLRPPTRSRRCSLYRGDTAPAAHAARAADRRDRAGSTHRLGCLAYRRGDADGLAQRRRRRRADAGRRARARVGAGRRRTAAGHRRLGTQLTRSVTERNPGAGAATTSGR